MPSIEFNPSYFLELGYMPLPVMMYRLFVDGAWLPMLVVMIQGFWLLWVQSRQNMFGATIEWTLLAIDIPRNNEQTPKAVEQIFATLSGAYSGFDTFQKYWQGKTNPSISLELVSVDGYVQYYIRCPRKLRDLIESAIYAQYPEAEITESPDYVETVPTVYPHPEYEAFGTEFTLKKPAAYPIRTYEEFEHKAAEVMTFKDPISGVLESFSSLRPGEQMWLQILCQPTDEAWQKAGQDIVDKIVGKPKVHKKTILGEIADLPMQVVAQATGIGAGPAVPEKKPETPKMMSLSPGEKNVLEAVQKKLSKIGFMCKIRTVYVAKRDIFNKGRFASLKGALNQFSTTDMNALKPYGPVTPKSDYPWQRWSENEKKTKIVRNYKGRSGKGASRFALNIEELATIYHFPMLSVKAPLVKKTDAKRAEPPSSLPTEDRYPRQPRPAASKGSGEKPPSLSDEDEDSGTPSNLPFA